MYKIIGKDKTYNIEPGQDAFTGVINDTEYSLNAVADGKGRFEIEHNGNRYRAEILEADYSAKKFVLKVNGTKYTLTAKDRMDALLKKLGMESLAVRKVKDIKAPMPGLVLGINVEIGQEVRKNDAILVLEAMKMENVIKSPAEGKIKSIEVKTGDAVDKNKVLIAFE